MGLLSLVVLPALFSLILKAVVLYSARRSLKKNNFTTLVYICTFQSLCEVVTFFSYSSGSNVELLFRLYYVFIIWWLSYSLIYIADVLKYSNKVKYFTLSIATAFSAILLFTNLIISGYYDIGYSITAIKENFYGLYQIFVFGIITACILVLAKNLIWPKNTKLQTQSFYLLVALSAPFITIISVTILMQLGIKVNMLMILPISTAIFVIFVVKCETKHDLIDIRRLLPWSKENRFASEINLIAAKCSMGEITLKEANNEFQKLLLEYQKDKGRNKHQAAKNLGISQSTFYSKLSALDVDWKEKRKN